jgi:ABC-2 type transport system permease protein
MPLTLLPFLGSGFVPTDSMPAGFRWFAEYQPFTPMMDTLRGLLIGSIDGAGPRATGASIGNSAIIAIAWCVGITAVGYLWSRKLYDRERVPR